MTAQQLKNSILQLAVQGKLVPQDPNDEPASDLLKRIWAEKEQLIKDGKLKKEKPLPPIADDEIPFDVPDNWEWVRLRSLGIFSGGKTPSMSKSEYWINGSIPWVSPKDMKVKYITSSEMMITSSAAETMKIYNTGTLVMVVRSGILKRLLPLSFLAVPSTINQDLKALELYDNKISDYLYFAIKAFEPYILFELVKAVTTVDSLKFDEFQDLLIPLPPVQEQQRICNRLLNIEKIIDRYDAVEKNLYTLNVKFPDQLKKSILQSAVQGKLVPQDKNDEPAALLLERIRVEKEQLIKDGKLKKEKPLPTITEDEIPFDVPESWEWMRLGTLINKITDGAHHTPRYTESGVPFLSVKDISSGIINFENTKFISPEEHAELYRRCDPEKGDILLTKVGTTGIPVLIDTDKEFSLFVSVALLKFNQKLLYGKYLVKLIESPLVELQCTENTRGVGNKNWVIRDIANTLVVLPPLAEQHRIVTKCEELMAMVDRLGGNG